MHSHGCFLKIWGLLIYIFQVSYGPTNLHSGVCSRGGWGGACSSTMHSLWCNCVGSFAQHIQDPHKGSSIGPHLMSSSRCHLFNTHVPIHSIVLTYMLFNIVTNTRVLVSPTLQNLQTLPLPPFKHLKIQNMLKHVCGWVGGTTRHLPPYNTWHWECDIVCGVPFLSGLCPCTHTGWS
jgi:hypothetical protein